MRKEFNLEFQKYMHVEKLGREEVDGILVGNCDIFPKLDGSNGMIYLDNDGHITCGSRNRALSETSDNQGFRDYVWNNVDKFNKYFSVHSEVTLYGEWLVPHTLKTYASDNWRNFYVFDVMIGDEYLNYDEYKDGLELHNIEFIPPICKVKNPTYERIVNQLEKNTLT